MNTSELAQIELNSPYPVWTVAHRLWLVAQIVALRTTSIQTKQLSVCCGATESEMVGFCSKCREAAEFQTCCSSCGKVVNLD